MLDLHQRTRVRPLNSRNLPGWLHQSGDLDVRLATSPGEIAAAQALRYHIFYEELGARPTPAMSAIRRDIDDYDAVCDHLLVIDRGGGRSRVVGTYRLLRQMVAVQHQGFYSAGEYDLTPLLAIAEPGQQLLELGRSCVAREHRNSATIALLWRGIASYLHAHNISHMFGCASLPGTDPDACSAELSYLHHHHLAPPELRARTLPQHFVETERLPIGSYDPKAAARALPPLLKGYLRVGAIIGHGAFVDRQFNTIDVFVLMPVERIAARYSERFTAAA